MENYAVWIGGILRWVVELCFLLAGLKLAELSRNRDTCMFILTCRPTVRLCSRLIYLLEFLVHLEWLEILLLEQRYEDSIHCHDISVPRLPLHTVVPEVRGEIFSGAGSFCLDVARDVE
jgi:hypothetical protein